MMNERDPYLGKIVQLKSGGPDMTIIGRVFGTTLEDAIMSTGVEFTCQWFNKKGKRKTKDFNINNLIF